MSLNFLHKDPEAIMDTRGACVKTAPTFVSSLIDAIPSVLISGYITEQCISAIDCNSLFSSLEK